jgi:hypothetical protein
MDSGFALRAPRNDERVVIAGVAEGRAAALAQYAFSPFNSAHGVFSRMNRSNSTDQFSM